jgi:hypothetical protein
MITGDPDLVAPFSDAVKADDRVFVPQPMPFADTALDPNYPEGIEAQAGIEIDHIAWRGNTPPPFTLNT